MKKLKCKTCLRTKELSQFGFNGGVYRRSCKQCQDELWEKNKLAAGQDPKLIRECSSFARITGRTVEEVVSHYSLQRMKQNNLCAICGKPEGKKKFSRDHCHKTGKYRGLLCDSCNKGIGIFEDDPLILRRAISYLEKWS